MLCSPGAPVPPCSLAPPWGAMACLRRTPAMTGCLVSLPQPAHRGDRHPGPVPPVAPLMRQRVWERSDIERAGLPAGTRDKEHLDLRRPLMALPRRLPTWQRGDPVRTVLTPL